MRWLGLAFVLLACGGGDAAPARDASLAADASVDAASPAAACASSFGNAMPTGYSRQDGTVLAVVTPADTQCAMPNSTHVVIELLVGGAVYREVVNVVSDRAGDPDVRFGELTHALVGPAWSEGFHPGFTMDYAQDLGLHAGQAPFSPTAMGTLVSELARRVPVGAKVSIYAQGGGASAHIVHRNGNNDDGAIVLDPDGPSPRFLVFHFVEQTF
jgi:hypothetical protein